MNRLVRIVGIFIMTVGVWASVCCAQDIAAEQEKFYKGLADIIERDMNSPDQCVTEVKRYYSDNEAFVKKIREQVAKGMEAMEKYVKESDGNITITDEQLQKMEKEAKARGVDTLDANPAKEPTRYSTLLGQFTMKYPKQGMDIAMMGMEFLPRDKVAE